ncbi:hypothetical protein [Xenophilus sp. Marseille-Q4582]|uniref:hypothetical protein n=1 Tax=Xenophilus sp. Marseille-Q4582 TaxID=2866600 RepID=UPI001CE487C2|nr:hypothetical protein [Xenophilus sp. Marseille-Q4582]
MTTHVTTLTVRTAQGELRTLQVLRHTQPEAREEFLLDGAPVERAEDGSFRVVATGEILRVEAGPG